MNKRSSADVSVHTLLKEGGGKKEFVLFFLFKAFAQREKVGDKHMQMREDGFDCTHSHI